MFSGKEQVLGRQERAELLELAKRVAGKHAIDACCAYGSKVAGYARPDSDYDLLLVLKNYSDVIKYTYVQNGLDVSVLMVDSKALVRDADKAILGEFVVGRLLHAYEPLKNAEYLENVETRYKKRVVLEEARELAATKALYTELLIPPEYFLFSKVRKRSKVYPHALYSYVKTYSGAGAKRNLEASKRGFMRALRELEREGYLQLGEEDSDGYVRILSEKIKVKKGDKASLEMSNVVRGTLAYLVHTYAGRRTLNFLKQEAVSKINRRKEIRRKLPPEIENPGSLLKMREGMLLEGRDWLRKLARSAGFEDYRVTRRKIGDLHAATILYTLSRDGDGGGSSRSAKFVVKHFASVKAVKWAAMNLWVAGVKRFDIDPAMRLSNEYSAMRYLKSMGIDTLAIVAVDLDRRLLITSYLEGKMLSEIIESVLQNKTSDTTAVTKFGRALSKLHANGCTVGDTKPSNMLLKNGRIHLTDLEQFSFVGEDKAWDLALFIYYSIKFTANDEAARRIVRAFLEGYLQDGNVSVARKALSKKYLPVFYPALVLGVIKAVRDEMRSCIRSFA